jgi:hypothetical protein
MDASDDNGSLGLSGSAVRVSRTQSSRPRNPRDHPSRTPNPRTSMPLSVRSIRPCRCWRSCRRAHRRSGRCCCDARDAGGVSSAGTCMGEDCGVRARPQPSLPANVPRRRPGPVSELPRHPDRPHVHATSYMRTKSSGCETPGEPQLHPRAADPVAGDGARAVDAPLTVGCETPRGRRWHPRTADLVAGGQLGVSRFRLLSRRAMCWLVARPCRRR